MEACRNGAKTGALCLPTRDELGRRAWNARPHSTTGGQPVKPPGSEPTVAQALSKPVAIARAVRRSIRRWASLAFSVVSRPSVTGLGKPTGCFCKPPGLNLVDPAEMQRMSCKGSF